MTKQEFEQIFRESPESMETALHAIKQVLSEYSDKSTTQKEKLKWESMFFHVLKTHGVTSLLFKTQKED